MNLTSGPAPTPELRREPRLLADGTFVDVRTHPDASRGTTTVLLPGLLMTHYMFHGVRQALAQTGPVWSVDLPGFGQSRTLRRIGARKLRDAWAEGVRTVLDASSGPRVDVVVHGLSACVLDSVIAHPRCGRVVALCPMLSGASIPWVRHWGLVPRAVRRALLAPQRRELQRYIEAGFAAPELVPDGLVDVCWSAASELGRGDAVEAALALVARLDEMRPRVERRRVHLVCGDRDAWLPEQDPDRLAHDLDPVSTTTIAGSGHLAPLERPEVVGVELCRSLGRTAP